MTFLLLAALMCPEPKQEGCKMACSALGYTSGLYQKKHCLCFDPYKYEDLKERQEPIGFYKETGQL